MRGTKAFSMLMGIMGAFLIFLAVGVSFRVRNVPARVISVSGEARQVTEDFMQAFSRADYGEAGALLLGKPRLELQDGPQSELGAILWNAYADSISFEFNGDIHASDSGYYRDVTVTVLDISGIMRLIKERAQTLLAERAETVSNEVALDDNDNYREDFVMDVLCDAAADILVEEPLYVSRKITLNLTNRDGQWWIVPDQSLQNLLAGGMGK